jgi:benzoylformate decarboxylase
MLADSAPRGPVYLSVPLDDWDKPVDEATVRHFMDRGCAASPVVAQGPLDELIDALRTASSPAMVLGPGVDTELGVASAVSLAERAHLPVYIAPSPPRSPFRTRHGSPRPSAPPTVPNRRRATCPPPTCPVPVTRPRRSSTPSTAERPTTR